MINEPYEIRVFLEDTDAGGIVYFANYMKYMERARTMVLHDKGIDHAQLIAEHKIMLVMRKCTVDYYGPARFGDIVSIYTEITEITGARLKIKQSIVMDGQVLVKADIVLACINLTERKPVRIPSVIVNSLLSE
ncbi:MAG: YbgC/FadM family acyl-CoA thioesterase [Alphaproteobacteria bacterium]|nr:YbgC/FadM family acyl-CoA thioesterase [Alphaproteobacteria bacterium]